LRFLDTDTPKKTFFRRSGNAVAPAYAPLKFFFWVCFTGTCHAIGHTRPCGLGAICNWVKVMDEEARAGKPKRGFHNETEKDT
jgi:hypothetical protein